MDNNTLKNLSNKYQLQPFSNLKAEGSDQPLIITGGEGVYITDIDGNRMVDGVGGLWNVNVGYNRQEIKDAIIEQLDKLAYYSAFSGTTHPPAIELSAKLINIAKQEDMARVMFSSNGSDAVETALKLARQYWRAVGEPERIKFFSLKEGYHGTHIGGSSVNGTASYRNTYEPLLPNCFQIDSPWLYRNPYTDDPTELGEMIAHILDREIIAQGPGTVAAFIAEPVQGSGGVIVPPENFWPLIREVCDKHGVLLIADEVVTGFGRSGTMFGSRTWGVKPDMMTLAKGITSGYMPLGATMINQRMNKAFEMNDIVTAHGYTYAGHPIACAAAIANLDIVEQENIPANARENGQYFFDRLSELKDKHMLIGDVRGKGLMCGLELVNNRQTKERLNPAFAKKIATQCREEGAMIRVLSSGLIILSPPLVIEKAELDVLVDALDKSIGEISD